MNAFKKTKDTKQKHFFAIASAPLFAVFSFNSILALAQTCQPPDTDALFNVAACVDGERKVLSFNNITDAVKSLDDSTLGYEFPSYQNNSQVDATLYIRGINANGSYAANSTTLNFNVPSIGISEKFDGGSRDASAEMLEDWLKKNGEDILRELIKVSPVDPIAGNPASLQTLMANTSYDLGTNPSFDNLQPGPSFGIGLRFGRYSSGQYDQDLMTLPLRYAYSFDSGDKLIISLPLTYVDTEGAKTYSVNFGIAYKKQLSDQWALTPSIGYGAVGSLDLGAAGQIMSASLTSDYIILDNSKYRLRMGNMVGYYSTLATNLGDYSVDYQLKNEITRNGISLLLPISKKIRGQKLAWNVYVIDTRYFGDDLYSNYSDEIGITLGTYGESSSKPIQIGLSYMRGDGDISSFDLSFGYNF